MGSIFWLVCGLVIALILMVMAVPMPPAYRRIMSMVLGAILMAWFAAGLLVYYFRGPF